MVSILKLRAGHKLYRSASSPKLLLTLALPQENTNETFQWRGSFYGLVVGHHQFYFKNSTKTPSGTTFVQTEDFNGILAWMFGPTQSYGKKTSAEFKSFNEDLKARVESL